MIVGITYEGRNNRKGEKEVDEFLDILSRDTRYEYYVGVDYASIYSDEYTEVTYCTKDEDGNMVVRGTELIK